MDKQQQKGKKKSQGCFTLKCSVIISYLVSITSNILLTVILYLSDHGLDIYNSSDDYAAHGKHSDSISRKYGSEIPLLIYSSNLYKEKYPDVINRISKSINKSFRTDNLMYLLMDIIGISFANNNNVETYSPLL